MRRKFLGITGYNTPKQQPPPDSIITPAGLLLISPLVGVPPPAGQQKNGKSHAHSLDKSKFSPQQGFNYSQYKDQVIQMHSLQANSFAPSQQARANKLIHQYSH